MHTPPLPYISIADLMRIEKDPSLSVFDKSLAALLAHYSLGDLDDSFWQSVANFEKLDPSPAPDLLPFLQTLAHQRLSPLQIRILGNVAYKANVLDSLPPQFANAYIKSLSIALKPNSYRAIELAKRYDLPAPVLVSLYLRAQQFQAAELLASSMIVPDELAVQFIVAYAEANNLGAVNKWISRLQAPDPKQIAKIYHFLVLYNLPVNLPSFGLQSEPRPKLDSQQRNLVTAINKLITQYPSILDSDDLYHPWTQLLLGNIAVIEPLLDGIVQQVQLLPGDLITVLRHSTKDLALKLVEKMNYNPQYPKMCPKDWCMVLSKLSRTDDIDLMIEQIKYGNCLNSQVVSALCPLCPRGLVDMVLECTPNNDLQILTAWRQLPTHQQAKALEPRSRMTSFAILRAILRAFVAHNDFVSVAKWLKYYQKDEHIKLPPAFVDELKLILRGKRIRPKKLSSPVKLPISIDNWQEVFRAACPANIDCEWVLQQL